MRALFHRNLDMRVMKQGHIQDTISRVQAGRFRHLLCENFNHVTEGPTDGLQSRLQATENRCSGSQLLADRMNKYEEGYS